MPTPRSRACAWEDGVGGGPQGRGRIEEVADQTLEQAGLAWIDADVVELDLRLSPGERGRPLKRSCVAMLVDQVEQGLARGRDHGPKSDARGRPGCDLHTPAQGEDRIEHRADRA